MPLSDSFSRDVKRRLAEQADLAQATTRALRWSRLVPDLYLPFVRR
jgi:hypothetical protein